MSSIAYVTDEEMLEYHRLCRNRTILFWRLASRRKIADFRKGDLLFFFAKPARTRKKALIGYAHYDSTKRLSLKQMWEKYGKETGYDSMKEKVADYNKLQEEIKSLTEQGKDVKALNEELNQKYLELLYSNPAGFRITAKMSTNYRALKTIYHQRKDHRLPEWRAFCEWVKTLPHSEFITGEISA